MKIIVIADDLTGAAEVAGAALRFGLSAEVQIGEFAPSTADVIVVDADSRSLGAEAAFRRVGQLTQQAVSMKPQLLFKKVDSLLRGPVLAELTAMRTAAGYERSLLVCGNPRKDRLVVAGKLYVGGCALHETEFARDPEHPCCTNDAFELLRQGAANGADDSPALDTLGIAAPHVRVTAQLLVGNASCAADLDLHAHHWLSHRTTTLVAGGAEFFEAILRASVGDRQANSIELTELAPRDVLLISGSRFSQVHDWPLVRCTSSLSSSECADEIYRCLANHGRAALRAVDMESGSPSARIDQIAGIAGRVLATCRPDQVWIEGGRTASTLMRELGYRRLLAVANVGDGVVALRVADEPSPLYLIKPGSYPWTPLTRKALPVVDQSKSANDTRWQPLSHGMLRKLLLLVPLIGLSRPTLADQPELDRAFRIIAEQCLDCHNATTNEGTVDLERFKSLDDVDRDRPLWKTVFDVVEAGQMPLPESGYELDDTQRQTLLSFARQVLVRPDPQLKAMDPGKPILRRLTRLEYNNTVRDLFGLNDDIFMFPERLPVADKRYFTESSNASGLGNVLQTSMREYGQKYDVLFPQLGLPGDNRAEHGFSNRGDTLNFSPLLFEKYLQMASAIARSERMLSDSQVMRDLLDVEPPERAVVAQADESVLLSGSFAPRERIGSQAADNDTWHNSFVSELSSAFEHGSGGTFDVPATLNNQSIPGKGGLLKLRLQGDVLLINPNVDLWLASFATADETSGDHLLTNRNQGEKVFELTFQGADSFEPEILHLGVCVLARRNQSGRVQLSAVLSNGQQVTRHADVSDASGNVFFSWVAPPGTSIRKLAVDGSQFSGDYVLLDDFGFVFANPTRPAVSTKPSTVPDRNPEERQRATLEDRIASFLRRAYRREVTQAELDAALAAVANWKKNGDSEVDALRRLVQSVLASPDFLYLAEPRTDSAAPVRRVEPYELANRLSYFLWSSMPDDELLSLAQSGVLDEPETLRSQVQRMLADRSRSRELSESFAVQWLRLDQLYSSKPDRQLYKSFYSGPQGKSTLHGPMMTEALLLFETVLIEDRSILELYDADFTWLNGQLAKLYGLEDSFQQAHLAAAAEGTIPESLPEKSSGSYWLRTSLPDRTRGGVMTMAGPLTLTSLPFRTSPIKRGAWLLETVFNRPPAEPKVAFVLEDAVEEKSSQQSSQTIRQLFEKHRSDPNCYSCHSRIDPPGFSLEVFDPMGSLRTHDGQQPVDASGTWNDQEFSNPAEFKDAIRVRERELVRGFVEHLLSYALGRQLEHFDMSTVDQIVANAARDEFRISAILEGIVLSYPFRHTRNLETR